jgi:hypothetical protein
MKKTTKLILSVAGLLVFALSITVFVLDIYIRRSEMSSTFVKDLDDAQGKRNYAQVIERRIDCDAGEITCASENAAIISLWLQDRGAQPVPPSFVKLMFLNTAKVIDSGRGRGLQVVPLVNYYSGLWVGSKLDIELADCWRRVRFTKSPTSVEQCEALEAKKYGRRRPWLD